MSNNTASSESRDEARPKRINPLFVMGAVFAVVIASSYLTYTAPGPTPPGTVVTQPPAAAASSTPSQMTIPIPATSNSLWPGAPGASVSVPTPSSSTVQKVDQAIGTAATTATTAGGVVEKGFNFLGSGIDFAKDTLDSATGRPAMVPQQSATRQ